MTATTTKTTSGTDRLARATRVLQVILGVAIVGSAVHYTDNAVRYGDYLPAEGEPTLAFITRPLVVVSWFAFTALAVAGYRAFRDRRWPLAAGLIGAYSASGLISVGHFLDVSPADYDAFQNVTIVIDIVVGSAVLAFALWLALTGAPDGDVDEAASGTA